jgi:hypothetical protein
VVPPTTFFTVPVTPLSAAGLDAEALGLADGFGVAVVVVAGSVTLMLMLYWLHGSMGQVLSGFLLVLFCMLAGGFAVSNALFAARGEVSRGTITAFTHHTTLRTSWESCRVRLDDGKDVARQIRCDGPSVGEHVTVTQDPTGVAAPALGDRTQGSPGLPCVVGAALLLLIATIVRATVSGERDRLAGTPSPAEGPNPGYYPSRLASPEYGSRRA